MMKNKLSRKQTVIFSLAFASFVVAIVLFFLMDFSSFGVRKITETSGEGILDAKIYYNSETVYEYFDAIGEDNFQTLKLVRILDYFFALSVAIFQICLIVLLSENDYKALLILPFSLLELMFDISENLFISIIQKKLPERRDVLAAMCGGTTLSKWIFTALTVVSIIVFFIVFIVKKNKNKEKMEEPRA